MPYRQITQLADNVKHNLPKYDKEVYKETFDSAEDPNGEVDRAHRVAWEGYLRTPVNRVKPGPSHGGSGSSCLMPRNS